MDWKEYCQIAIFITLLFIGACLFRNLHILIDFPWIWAWFMVGCIGAFIIEFVRFVRQIKIPLQTFMIGETPIIQTKKFNYFAILISLVYIIIGGVLAAIFATTKHEALLYGGLWEYLFTYVIRFRR